jgi:RNA polymerase sigma factor (sigma-70 family)
MASVVPELPVLARDQAFELLYRRYVEDVYHYALALLRNPADAEDVTQTTFMNAYRAYKRGEEIEKPQNWLIKIAHNVARSRYARANRRVKEVPLEEHVEHLAVPEEERPDVEGVLRALGRLPFNQRAALVMRELEGRSYAEIADTIGVSVPAVETLIFRARKSLRMRASALRSLAAVPLPSSLTQLFQGGGVAGGGALVGSGFAVKATIALLAGAVATGVGGSHSGPATAAPKSAPVTSPASTDVVTQRNLRKMDARDVRKASQKTTAARASLPAAVTGQKQVPATAAHGTGGTAVTSGSATTAVTGKVVSDVTDLVDTVEKTAADPLAVVPVQVPSLPPLPVELPPPPPVPSLP